MDDGPIGAGFVRRLFDRVKCALGFCSRRSDDGQPKSSAARTTDNREESQIEANVDRTDGNVPEFARRRAPVVEHSASTYCCDTCGSPGIDCGSYEWAMHKLAWSTKAANRVLEKLNVDENAVNAVADVRRAISAYQRVLVFCVETIKKRYCRPVDLHHHRHRDHVARAAVHRRCDGMTTCDCRAISNALRDVTRNQTELVALIATVSRHVQQQRHWPPKRRHADVSSSESEESVYFDAENCPGHRFAAENDRPSHEREKSDSVVDCNDGEPRLMCATNAENTVDFVGPASKTSYGALDTCNANDVIEPWDDNESNNNKIIPSTTTLKNQSRRVGKTVARKVAKKIAAAEDQTDFRSPLKSSTAYKSGGRVPDKSLVAADTTATRRESGGGNRNSKFQRMNVRPERDARIEKNEVEKSVINSNAAAANRPFVTKQVFCR